MRAIIISIGDELVLGQTVDTNSAWLSAELAGMGIGVGAHITVSDEQRAIEQAMAESVGRCDVLLVTGGLGPTEDDLTRQALAAVLGEPLEVNAEALATLEEFFARLKREMPASNRIQAMIPRGAKAIANGNGTAPGIEVDYRSGDMKTLCRVFVMPGVPKEMKLMWERSIRPALASAGDGAVILSRTLHTFGLGESTVAERLGELMTRGRNPSVGTTVSGGVVSLRINARFGSRGEAEREMAATEGACRAALGELVYGADGETLAEVVAGLLRGHAVARQYAPAVCTVESCTGGLLAKYLTDVPGSSAYFRQGWVTYHNEAKEGLGVRRETLERHGAVSEATVREMARRGVEVSGAAFGLAISGIAGPTGGTAEKPVGTVCIALAHPEGEEARTFMFSGDREMIRDRSAKMALSMLRYHLMGRPMPF